jgi:hypothetical protein
VSFEARNQKSVGRRNTENLHLFNTAMCLTISQFCGIYPLIRERPRPAI